MERLLRQNEEEHLFKGKNIHCRNEPLFKGCGNSLVYRGHFKAKENSKEEEIVVRRIKKTDCDDQWEDIFVKHTQEEDAIKHDNVLKIISYEEKNEWRYFALEHYDATLEQFCKGIYKGPMPSDAQVLCQITKGLSYLHNNEQCTHGNLTPRTILIASSQPVRIKLSEFGLKKYGDQFDDVGEEQELCQTKYWRLDGTTDSNQQTPTPNQDIFAAGCLCFYFLTRGVHPYGDDESSILENIKMRNPVNLKLITQQEKGIWKFAYDPIKHMIGNPPTDGKNWLMIAKKSFMKALPLKVDETKKLGSGTYGNVYKGTFEGNAVAVKIFKERSDDERKKEQKREMKQHLRLDHENVLKLLHVDELRNQTCLVLELCAGTLKDYCEKKYNGPMPPDEIVLYQIANGLHYIHSRNLVHRDVKPDNILISMTTPVQMKLSDFGFVKKISPQETFEQSGIKGTPNWMAPEILELLDDNITELQHGTIQRDTFAAGCVFFYFLTRGKHPFEKLLHNQSEHPGGKIKKAKTLIEHYKSNLQGVDVAIYELIGKMIKPKEERISLPDVIKQLTTNLTAPRQFKRVERLLREGSGKFVSLLPRFHPTKLIIVCGIKDEIIFFSAENSSISFSNWKEDANKFKIGLLQIKTLMLEWNVDGTQLAAVSREGDFIVCWNYPSGVILFQKKLDRWKTSIYWNPFRPNVFASFYKSSFGSSKFVSFFNSCPAVDQRPFNFCTIEHEERISSVQWISENQIALSLQYGRGIEIREIEESTTSAQIVKRFQHQGVSNWIVDMAWDERTKCLAACSYDGWMTIWSMDSDQPIHATKVEHSKCVSLAWRPNGKPTDDDEGVDATRKSADIFILACGLHDGRIVVWTPLAEKETRFFISQPSKLIEWLSFSPDGRFLASWSLDQKLIIWSTEGWEPVYSGEGEGWVQRFSWMSPSTDVPDYKLAFTSYDDKVRVIEYAVDRAQSQTKTEAPMMKMAKELQKLAANIQSDPVAT